VKWSEGKNAKPRTVDSEGAGSACTRHLRAAGLVEIAARIGRNNENKVRTSRKSGIGGTEDRTEARNKKPTLTDNIPPSTSPPGSPAILAQEARCRGGGDEDVPSASGLVFNFIFR
jgi:hypothetical protein